MTRNRALWSAFGYGSRLAELMTHSSEVVLELYGPLHHSDGRMGWDCRLDRWCGWLLLRKPQTHGRPVRGGKQAGNSGRVALVH